MLQEYIQSHAATAVTEMLAMLHTVVVQLIAAASNQKIFSGQLATASIQERPLIKK